MLDDLVFRDADPSKNEELSRIMINAFIPVWFVVILLSCVEVLLNLARNHNWYYCLTAPLAMIPSTPSVLTTLQFQRLAFHRA